MDIDDLSKRNKSFRVRITITRAGTKVDEATPEVVDMKTAHSIGQRLKEANNADDYHIIRLISEIG